MKSNKMNIEILVFIAKSSDYPPWASKSWRISFFFSRGVRTRFFASISRISVVSFIVAEA